MKVMNATSCKASLTIAKIVNETTNKILRIPKRFDACAVADKGVMPLVQGYWIVRANILQMFHHEFA